MNKVRQAIGRPTEEFLQDFTATVRKSLESGENGTLVLCTAGVTKDNADSDQVKFAFMSHNVEMVIRSLVAHGTAMGQPDQAMQLANDCIKIGLEVRRRLQEIANTKAKSN